MPKAMASAPGKAFAAPIASRRVHSVTSQTPSPGSPVELTVKVAACATGTGPPASTAADATKISGRSRAYVIPALPWRTVARGANHTPVRGRVNLAQRGGAAGRLLQPELLGRRPGGGAPLTAFGWAGTITSLRGDTPPP